MRNEKGFALILTLVITALMVAMTAEMIHQVYVDTSLSRGFRDTQQASLMAESGARCGVKLLQNALSDQEYSAIIAPMRQEDETGTLEMSITEESGKINLNDLINPSGEKNDAIEGMLKRLGKQFNIPEDVWEALADWLDRDDLARSAGAETPYYQTQLPAYSARNGKLITLTELSLVKGFTPEIVDRLRPFVTVFPNRVGERPSTININTAPKEVIMALSDRIDASLAERIVVGRRLQPYRTLGDLSRVSGGAAVSQELARNANVRGDIFRITALARVKESTRVVDAVARLSGEFLLWQEY